MVRLRPLIKSGRGYDHLSIAKISFVGVLKALTLDQ